MCPRTVFFLGSMSAFDAIARPPVQFSRSRRDACTRLAVSSETTAGCLPRAGCKSLPFRIRETVKPNAARVEIARVKRRKTSPTFPELRSVSSFKPDPTISATSDSPEVTSRDPCGISARFSSDYTCKLIPNESRRYYDQFRYKTHNRRCLERET